MEDNRDLTESEKISEGMRQAEAENDKRRKSNQRKAVVLLAAAIAAIAVPFLFTRYILFVIPYEILLWFGISVWYWKKFGVH